MMSFRPTRWSVVFVSLVVATMAAGCGDDTAGTNNDNANGNANSNVNTTPLGEPCDATTFCEGLCLLGVPGGLCSVACAGDPPTCPTGFACAQAVRDVSDGTPYCVPECQLDMDCRQDYICIIGACELPLVMGFDCEEPADCTDGICEGGLCTRNCGDSGDCPSGFHCAGNLDGDLVCAPIPADLGPGTTGYSCAVEACAADYTCVDGGLGDPGAYCSEACLADVDCPPGMRCREDGQTTSFCLRPGFCDECQTDDQCGFPGEKCVAADPQVAPGDRYCSTICDPNQPSTCPTDSTCIEAVLCQLTNTFMADCGSCSGSCGPAQPDPVYQCFKDYGSCVGDGSRCSPCVDDGDCTSGPCVAGFSSNNFTCAGPCDATCGPGFICADLTVHGPQCVPRTGSCSTPSGGGPECQFCATFTDCLTGFCAEVVPSGFTACLGSCQTDPDCPAYMRCRNRLTPVWGNQMVCVPEDISDNCIQWQNCITVCPTGPTSCSAGAPGYCHCGNSSIEAALGETCDGTDIGVETCQSQGFAGGGTLGCNATCTAFVTSGCIP